ncbi:MAG: type II toxin-antitoxin system HicA family toxin [Rhodospirillales bacterium]
MKREQFLSHLRRYCRKTGLTMVVDEKRGKGSHMGIMVGARRTIVPSGELKPGSIRTILRQLGLPPDALN